MARTGEDRVIAGGLVARTGDNRGISGGLVARSVRGGVGEGDADFRGPGLWWCRGRKVLLQKGYITK